jgi:alkylation response protein AidB-like acyl-CoA dehydrogenase
MNPVPHPSDFIDPVKTGILRERAAEAEASGMLHSQQLSMIRTEGWFKLFVPKKFRGLDLSLPEGLRVQEALAWADGSTGWTVTLCSGANWFIGFLPEEISAELFYDDKVCLSGSGTPSGQATFTNPGYKINGAWNYATGAPHATAFTANCFIEQEDGPLIKAFIFLKDEVDVVNNWKVMGMIATASHRFMVKDLLVKENRSFFIEPGRAVLPQLIYQYPFQQFAEATLAVNLSGMAVRFLELCQKQPISERAVIELGEARAVFYSAISSSWNDLSGVRSIDPILLELVSRTSKELAAISRRLSDEVFPYCGMIAANPDSEINRVWRNIHVASLHSLLK